MKTSLEKKTTAYLVLHKFISLLIAGINKIESSSPKEKNVENHAIEDSEVQNPEYFIEKGDVLHQHIIQSLKDAGIDCEDVQQNDDDVLPIEQPPYYSYNFPMTPRIVTNRGCIRIKNRNFDFIQIIQKN